jgi:hypothetical protein
MLEGGPTSIRLNLFGYIHDFSFNTHIIREFDKFNVLFTFYSLSFEFHFPHISREGINT